ncbi:uncharacterized protein V6R79_014759 [Siganus canaliculatus]
MSHKCQGEASVEAGEESKAPPLRSRQSNGTTARDPPPPRRSWRPCQMLNQDGELNPHHHHHHHHHHPPHHHHHPPPGRGPPRHRRRPPSGQAQSPGVVPTETPPRQETAESQEAEPRPTQPRPAVTRYRRHGDPNPRHRGHKHRKPVGEMQESSPGGDEREGPAEVLVQQHSSGDTVMDQLQDRGSSHQTPVAVVTPTHLSPGPDLQHHTQHPPPAEEDLPEGKEEPEDQKENVDKEEELDQLEDDGDLQHSSAGQSSCSHDDMQAEEPTEPVEDQETVTEDAVEDSGAQGSEFTDLCSDTESAASLSMDGPLHSPPPLQSPTPPSSPDVPPFPQLDHFSEDTKSRQKSFPRSVNKPYSEPKSHPNCFPEPLKTSYPELHREPRRQPGWRSEPREAQQESRQEPVPSHRQENVQKAAPLSPNKGSHHAPRQGRDRGPHHSPPDRSVGCRLHHYDGQSDSEGDASDQSPLPKSLRHRQVESEARSPSSGLSRNQEDRAVTSPPGEEGVRGSGDAISLAIKDIREAIEEVKTKAVRSPYTPDRPVEPIWVMRQEVSPTEEGYPAQPAAGQSSPQSPSQSSSESPSRYASVQAREPVSPHRQDSARPPHPQHYPQQQLHHNHHHHHPHHHHQGHHTQQREPTRPPQPYAHMPPAQHQQRQHQHPQQHQQHQQHQQLPAQQPRPPVQPASPPQPPSVQELRRSLPQFPTFVDVPGPCDPEDLIDGIIFAATYLGCTHLLSERTPTKSARMQQAQEAMSRVRAAQKQAKNRKKSPDGEPPSTAEVDLFMSTQRIKVLNADTQESLMDLPLRTISYIADIGNMVVLMARGKMVRSRSAQENLEHTAEQTTMTHDDRRLYRMICHVFESEDAQLIAQSIGQSFSVAYQEFLRANGIDPEDLSQREYSDLLNTQDMYNDDLIHFSKSENCRDVYIEKQKGEILGVVIVESGWGSILPTVIIASLMHAGPAEKSGRLNIGDQIMTINGTSLVGLPLSTCQSIIKGLKSQCRIKMNIVRCPPVTMVLIRRPDLRYQLGFSVQNGIICSLMRGGIAERGGVRVGHRIIEINSQSVVATPHEKIVQILSNAMGEIHMKTMPAAMYRLLTAQEQPVYI